mmetsp:Transcript_76312/g.193687  ORF Transcript_76312/g.193687 Transcript_76312/m.193687 type:complete len:317 (-) Transcript_76312:491-1441(-)
MPQQVSPSRQGLRPGKSSKQRTNGKESLLLHHAEGTAPKQQHLCMAPSSQHPPPGGRSKGERWRPWCARGAWAAAAEAAPANGLQMELGIAQDAGARCTGACGLAALAFGKDQPRRAASGPAIQSWQPCLMPSSSAYLQMPRTLGVGCKPWVWAAASLTQLTAWPTYAATSPTSHTRRPAARPLRSRRRRRRCQWRRPRGPEVCRAATTTTSARPSRQWCRARCPRPAAPSSRPRRHPRATLPAHAPRSGTTRGPQCRRRHLGSAAAALQASCRGRRSFHPRARRSRRPARHGWPAPSPQVWPSRCHARLQQQSRP